MNCTNFPDHACAAGNPARCRGASLRRLCELAGPMRLASYSRLLAENPPEGIEPGTVPPWEWPAWRRSQERKDRCSHRYRLPAELQSSCGCKVGCGAGHPLRWPDGAIDDLACYECVGKRVRVAFWGPVFSPIGGTETWHAQVARWFDPLRVAILGCAVGEAPDLAEARRRFAPYPVEVGPSAAVRIALDADVVIAWGGDAAWRSQMPAGWPGKVVAVCHGDSNSAWSVGTMAAVSPLAERMAAVSPGALLALPEERRGSAWLIPNALEPFEGPPAWDRAREAPRRRIGYIGRVAPEKRPELAARAAGYLPEGYEVELCGPDPGWLAEALSGRPLAAPVRALGPKPHEDAQAFLRTLGALVVPSENEGFGYVIGEAWAAGVPVLATPRGLAAHHPDCCAILPADPSPEEIARAAEGLWADPEGTTRMVARARELVVDQYSPRRWARVWENRIVALAKS